MPATINQALFTVYLTAQGIELRSGCEDYPNCHPLHTSKSYELAHQFAQVASENRNLPITILLDK